MQIQPPPGLFLDITPVSPVPRWNIGFNVRFRLEQIETIGLFGPLQDTTDAQIVLPVTAGGNPYRKAYTTPNTVVGQILFGASDHVQLVDYDPNSTPVTGTRWRQIEVTPAGLPVISDGVIDPAAGRVAIPPVWWFADQDDLVVGCRANVATEPCYAWGRDRTVPMVPLANSPTGAVGGGIINRILVLLGCSSFTDPDPQRFMTIRWSDRFNFEEWTPSDINLSGELQLEGGSRIVGGGVTGFGVVAWTDRRMAILTENGDINSVFSRRYIDGARGMLANNTWAEADGQIWWYDEHRVLNVYDGGRPRQIPNPLKTATLERLEERQVARAYLEHNQEYGEIILHYPDLDATNPDTQLVYNYILDAWSIWRLNRTGWTPRFGTITTLGVDDANQVWRHDLDVSLPDAYITGPGNPNPAMASVKAYTAANLQNTPPATEVEPFDFAVLTNLITTEDVTSVAWHMTRIMADHLPSPAVGAELDTFDIVLTGYGEAQVDSAIQQDWQTYLQGQNAMDFRVGGKALQIGIYGKQVKTLFRFGAFQVTPGEDGER